jgi:hypothetical protein
MPASSGLSFGPARKCARESARAAEGEFGKREVLERGIKVASIPSARRNWTRLLRGAAQFSKRDAEKVARRNRPASTPESFAGWNGEIVGDCWTYEVAVW